MALPSPTVWLVDDDRSIRTVLTRALREAGFVVQSFEAAAPALAALDEADPPGLLFTDVRMPGQDGLAFLKRLRRQYPSLPVVVMSAYTDLATTVGAFSEGAFEYLPKPFDLDDAVEIARRALDPDGAAALELPAGLIGDSPAMREVFRAIGRLSRAELTVLITGETGTGKELVARALHQHSPRAKGPFVALNTAAIAPELLESELFGHEQGAFTGALRRHVGRFEQAHGGTLFLDEIGDMTPGLQTRLLRVLAEGEFYRVGGRELIRADVRILAATHQDLALAVTQGRFRADLLHRLDVVRIQLPPLRERREDVPTLAERFLADAARELGVGGKRLSAPAAARMAAHDWPGNVRELRNLCHRLTALAPGREIQVREVEAELARGSSTAPTSTAVSTAGAPDWSSALAGWVARELDAGGGDILTRAREQLEQVVFDVALTRTDGDRQHAARLIGCGRNTLTRRLGRKR
ncbi:MAG: nitrogen regulation protein NR(I) [Xanthomonadales bacterium]|jgi:two-component system nitrogen regulation response regulator GlnG|nr:nitrogen regulation protein NR(I) [Xanthomonadales bacterium]